MSTHEHPAANTRGDRAIQTIDQFRSVVEDYTRLDPLGAEFPTLPREISEESDSDNEEKFWAFYTDDNKAGTFKWRGAFNKVAALSQQSVSRIVVPSAGNHARGAVLAAKQFGMEISVVVPTTAPPAKKEGLRDLWSSSKLQIYSHGDSFDESLVFALNHPELGELMHPYDDPEVIAGQGTIADDFDRLANNKIDHLVLPVGGGGLAAGILNRLQELKNAHTLLHIAMPEASNSLSRSLATGEPIAAENPNQNYGGSAVRKIGKHTFDIIFKHRRRIVMHHIGDSAVNNIIAGYQLERRERGIEHIPAIEPTALIGAAAVGQVAAAYPGQSLALLLTGHNAPLEPSPTKRQRLRVLS